MKDNYIVGLFTGENDLIADLTGIKIPTFSEAKDLLKGILRGIRWIDGEEGGSKIANWIGDSVICSFHHLTDGVLVLTQKQVQGKLPEPDDTQSALKMSITEEFAEIKIDIW